MTINDIATPEEVKEAKAIGQFAAPHHDPSCTADHLVLLAAYRMMGAQYWHVIRHAPSRARPDFRFAQSTLSMLGLKEWGLL